MYGSGAQGWSARPRIEARPRRTEPRPASAGALSDTGLAVAKACFLLIVVVASSNINPVILGYPPETPTSLQQYVTLILWCGLIYATLLRADAYVVRLSADVALGAAFIGYAIVSASWSGSEASLLKAAALLVTTVGAYRVAATLPFATILTCIVGGLFATAAASLATVALVPSIGVIDTWMHRGQWSGLFESKQSLGAVGAFLVFFAYCRYALLGGRIELAVCSLVGAAAVIGSGSRGGGAIAACAILCNLLSRRSRAVAVVLACLPFAVAVAVGAVLLDLRSSGAAKLEILGLDTDLTERVLIWQFALLKFTDGVELFGFGLNGFWTDLDLYYQFDRWHGWVLDNFHSGFLTTLIELGFVGYGLYGGLCLAYGARICGRLFREGRSERIDICSNFLCLFSVFNITETWLLRSTNVVGSLAILLLLVTSRRPAARPRQAQRAGGRLAGRSGA